MNIVDDGTIYRGIAVFRDEINLIFVAINIFLLASPNDAFFRPVFISFVIIDEITNLWLHGYEESFPLKH